MIRVARLAGLALAIGAALTACGGLTANSPSTTAPDTTRAHVIGILVGTSPIDHSPQVSARWSADAAMVAAAAGQSGSHVIIDRFGSGPDSSHVAYNTRVASTNGQNHLIRSVQLKRAERALGQAFMREQATITRGPMDVMSGLVAMAQHLHAIRHTAATDVLIFGNAVQTAPPINLSDPMQLADAKTSVRAVESQGLLPDCTGWRVYMVGGSLAANGGLGALRDEQLREFWRQLFVKCGGRLVLWDTTLTSFPVKGEVAPASWAKRKQIVIPLSPSVLFRPDKAVLRPGANQTLNELVRLLVQTHPTATAEVAGHAAAVGGGTEATALALSKARAQVVAGYLMAHGIRASRLSIVGYGDRHPVATNTTESGRALNRCVVVTLRNL